MAEIDLWPKHRCREETIPSGAEIDRFELVLNDAADERPLQTFLAAHSHLLTCLLPPGRGAWCFDRPHLGSELIPDFLLCTQNSSGIQWCMVELESPTRQPLTYAGIPTQKLNQALTQVRDWRMWLRVNIAYARHQLGFRDLDAECRAFVIIGRRHGIEARHVGRYRELSDEYTTIMTFDRLLDAMVRGRSLTEGSYG